MRYFKKLLGSVREFKAPAIFTIIFIILEVFIEVVIPFITADMVNAIKDGAALGGVVVRRGGGLSGIKGLGRLRAQSAPRHLLPGPGLFL